MTVTPQVCYTDTASGRIVWLWDSVNRTWVKADYFLRK